MLTAVGLWSMRFHGLWTAQVMSVRSIEVSRIFRAIVTVSALALVLDRKSSTIDSRRQSRRRRRRRTRRVDRCGAPSYRAFLNAERRRGRYTSRVAFVGTGRQANELSRLFVVHPELGMRVTAVIGARQEAMASGMGDLWRGTLRRGAHGAGNRSDVDVVVLCSAELDRWQLNELSADAAARGRMLYVDPGLSGIDFKRMHTTAIGYQPLLEMSGAIAERAAGCRSSVCSTSSSPAIVAVLAAPVLLLVARPDQARGRWPGAVPAASRGPQRRGLRDPQVPHDGRRRRGSAGRRCRAPTSGAVRCSRWSRTRGSPASAASCGRRASTSCLSCSTCSTAR